MEETMANKKLILESEFTTTEALFDALRTLDDKLTFNQMRRLADFAGRHLPGRVQIWQRTPKSTTDCHVIRPDMTAKIKANHRAFIRSSFMLPD